MAGSRELTELGRLIEDARVNKVGISAREAARRAQISESRWRQVVTGVQAAGGTRVPVTPTVRTVIAMAVAVEVRPEAALRAAGVTASAELVESVIRQHTAHEAAPPKQPEPFDLDEEVDRVLARQGISASTKRKIIDNLIDAHKEQQSAAQPRHEAR